LSDGAQYDGTMSLDEFEEICLAGNVPMDVASEIVRGLEQEGERLAIFCSCALSIA
jgi:hypothetical protein